MAVAPWKCIRRFTDIRSPGNDFRCYEPVPQPLALDARIVLIFLPQMSVVEIDIDEFIGVMRRRFSLEAGGGLPAKSLYPRPVNIGGLLSIQDSLERRPELLQGHENPIQPGMRAFHR
jgi:hypothetical protein